MNANLFIDIEIQPEVLVKFKALKTACKHKYSYGHLLEWVYVSQLAWKIHEEMACWCDVKCFLGVNSVSLNIYHSSFSRNPWWYIVVKHKRKFCIFIYLKNPARDGLKVGTLVYQSECLLSTVHLGVVEVWILACLSSVIV